MLPHSEGSCTWVSLEGGKTPSKANERTPTWRLFLKFLNYIQSLYMVLWYIRTLSCKYILYVEHIPPHPPTLPSSLCFCFWVLVCSVCVCVFCIYMTKIIFVFWRPANQNTAAVIDTEYVFSNKTLSRSEGLISTFPVNLSITDNVGTDCSTAMHD